MIKPTVGQVGAEWRSVVEEALMLSAECAEDITGTLAFVTREDIYSHKRPLQETGHG